MTHARTTRRLNPTISITSLAIAGGLLLSGHVEATPNTYAAEKVFVYNGTWNGRHDNGYNNDAWYWSMQEACLLDENGLWPRDEDYNEDEHPTPPAVATNNGHVGDVLLNRAGEVIGFELTDANGSGPIGYTNLDGTKVVYNLNEWTLVDIYARHPNVPSVTISKHGGPGYVHLDDGRPFTGFTGAPYPCWTPGGPQPPLPPVPPPPGPGGGGGTTPPPYPLPSNGTGNSDLFVNACHSNTPPPIPGGVSVRDSAGAIPGITATGNDGVVYKPMTISYCPPFGLFCWTCVLLEELEARTGVSGEANLVAHLQAMRPDEMSALLQEVEDAIGGEFKCSAGKSGAWDAPGLFEIIWNDDNPEWIDEVLIHPQAYYECPVLMDKDGGSVEYTPPSGLFVHLDVPRGAIEGPAIPVYVTPTNLVDSLPAGVAAMAPPVLIHNYELGQKLVFHDAASLSLRTKGDVANYLGLFHLDDEGRVTLTESTISEDGVVSASVQGVCGGVYVAVGLAETNRRDRRR